MDLKRIDAHEAQRLVAEGYVLLDVRSVPEYAAEHPQGAFNVPFLHRTAQGMLPNADFSKVVQAVFPDRDARIITTCQMGGRSVRAAAELQNLGYVNVVDLRGGFSSERDDAGAIVHQGWRDSGLPTETGEPSDRSYGALEARATPPKPAEPAHAHSHGPQASADGMNRFASDKRAVQCQKLGRQLPGLKRRPYPGPLGERIFAEISAEAWNQWVEHSKMIINEYRIQASDPQSMKVLMEQCEAFLFGAGVAKPEGYVPSAQ